MASCLLSVARFLDRVVDLFTRFVTEPYVA
jgi:hypothetical protein